MIGTYTTTDGPAPTTLHDFKRRPNQPLRLFRAWDRLSPRDLALIPKFCYTAIVLHRMTWPQLAAPREQPMEKI